MKLIVSDIHYDCTVKLTENYIDVRLCELGGDSPIYYNLSGFQKIENRESLKKKILPNYCPKIGNNNIMAPIFSIIIKYPINKTVEVPINLVNITWADLLIFISDAYNELYNNQDKYGIKFWGHSIKDLALGRLIFRKDPVYNKNIIHLYIDS